MNRQTRTPTDDDVEIGQIPFGGELAPRMILCHHEIELHVYERPRGGGDLRYVMTMPVPNGTPPVITGVAPDTWISGVGLNGLKHAAVRVWQSRPRE